MIQKVLKLFFVICVLSIASIQAQTVTGTITDATDGTPLPGVNIVIKGTNTGASSDFDGKYSIDVSSQSAVLQFSYLGYATKEITVNGKTVINVVLEQSAVVYSKPDSTITDKVVEKPRAILPSPPFITIN